MHGDALEWRWRGLTLNPYYEDNDPQAMIDADQFINDTASNWYFGGDDTGNIMHADNVRCLWRQAQGLGDVMLVTGDGSISCSHAPNEQESIVAQLHYCEVVAGIGMLQHGGGHGGAMVIKMFTLFERRTVDLLYLLGCVFEEVWVSKPACSTASNAETYLVCKGEWGTLKVEVMPTIPHEFPEIGRAHV